MNYEFCIVKQERKMPMPASSSVASTAALFHTS